MTDPSVPLGDTPTVLGGPGDCMLAAWTLLMALPDGAELCHGIVRARGDLTGETMWHAWIEYDGLCLDFSNGRRAIVGREWFYMFAAVAAHQVRRYDYAAAIAEADRYGTCGPWPPPDQGPTGRTT